MKPIIRDSQAIFHAAIRSVQPDRLLQNFDLAEAAGQPLANFERVFVVGAGKASMAMAGALENLLPAQLAGGQVVVPHGYSATLPANQRRPAVIKVLESGHPVPDEASVRAATDALTTAQQCGPKDLLLVLLSGGGSALWCAPAAGISLADLGHANRALLHSGAAIHEMNAVRKHLSAVKGGRLAAAAWPATSLTIVISDVPGDDLSVIASGPTVSDPSSFGEARAVLDRYGLWECVPESVREHLLAGVQGHIPETPGPGANSLSRAHVRLVGTNRHALMSAAARAENLGYKPAVRCDVTGEARKVGQALAETILTQPSRTCLLWGGETTVRVTGTGVGGRNHEVALAAAIAMEDSGRDVAVLSGGTDGVDGPTGAAGAWATPQTVVCSETARAALRDNDSYPFFVTAEGSIETGPTHTNVMDVIVALAA